MIVWLWAAGSAVGVTDDHANARRAAVFFMRSAGAAAAVVEQAYFISGARSLGPATSGTALRAGSRAVTPAAGSAGGCVRPTPGWLA